MIAASPAARSDSADKVSDSVPTRQNGRPGPSEGDAQDEFLPFLVSPQAAVMTLAAVIKNVRLAHPFMGCISPMRRCTSAACGNRHHGCTRTRKRDRTDRS